MPSNVANAAVHYRKAIALLPKFTAPEQQALEKFRETPLNKIAKAMILQAEPALQEIPQGAALCHCDWGVDLTQNLLEGSGNQMLMALSQINQLGCLRARLAFHQGAPEAAIDDLVALIASARHVGKTGPLMPKMTEIAMEMRAIELGASHLPEQSRPMLKDFEARLLHLAPAGTLKEAMQGEKAFCRLYTRPKFQNMSIEEVLDYTRKTESAEAARAIRKASGNTKEGLLALIDQADQMYDELGDVFMLPEPQFAPALGNCYGRYATSNPALSSIFKHAAGVRYAARRSAICFDMLKAGLLMLLGGFGKLQDYRDASGDGPYTCKQLKGGFELHSNVVFRNQPPVSLRFGKDRSLLASLRRIWTALLKFIEFPFRLPKGTAQE